MSLRFEDPGPEGSHRPHGRAHLTDQLDELRQHPGDWAVIAVYPTANAQTARSVASAISRGVTKAYQPAGCFETTTRRRDDGVRLYARYVGGAQ